MKRLIALTLVLLLLLPTAVVAEAEPTTVRLFYPTTRKETEDTVLINEVFKNEIGVNIELLTTPTDNWQQKYAMLLASKEPIDVAVLSPTAPYYSYAADGAYMDITDLVENYPNLMEYVPQEMWDRVKIDGRIYGVPTVNYSGKWNIYYRQDWLDKLGLEVPTTLDEFYNVMHAFTYNDPDGNGVDDTHGFIDTDTALVCKAVAGAFGVQQGYFSLEGDKISTHSISDNYRAALEYISKMFKEGLIDPEQFIVKEEQVNQKFLGSKVGAVCGWWSWSGSHYRDYMFLDENPDGVISIGVPPTGPNGAKGMPAVDGLTSILAIHRDCKNPEAVLKFIDFQTTLYGNRVGSYGVENLHWKADETGNLVFTSVTDPSKKDLNGKDVDPNALEVYRIIMRLDSYPERMIGDDIVNTHYRNAMLAADNNGLISNVFVGIQTEEYSTLMADVTKYESEMAIKFIMGDESFDNWDKYVEQWKALGGEEVRQSLLKYYNETNGTSYAFLEE